MGQWMMNKPIDETDVTFPPTLMQFVEPNKPKSLEQSIAWKLVKQNVADVVIGLPEHRLRYIEEIREWMVGDSKADYWTFDYWCELLEHDSGYMRKHWMAFLDKCEETARVDLVTRIKYVNDHEMIPHKLRKGVWICQRCDLRGLARAEEVACK
jgi:hypothetical protein